MGKIKRSQFAVFLNVYVPSKICYNKIRNHSISGKGRLFLKVCPTCGSLLADNAIKCKKCFTPSASLYTWDIYQEREALKQYRARLAALHKSGVISFCPKCLSTDVTLGPYLLTPPKNWPVGHHTFRQRRKLRIAWGKQIQLSLIHILLLSAHVH